MKPLNPCGYVVYMSENALVSCVLNVLEAYTVTPKGRLAGREGLETYGSLYGQVLEVEGGPTVCRVELANVDTSTKQGGDFVDYNQDAMVLKADTTAAFWPHLSFLGDFHSHTYSSVKDAEEMRGYLFSDDDWKDMERNKNFWKELSMKVSLLFTVAGLERAGNKPAWWIDGLDHCIQFTLGNMRLWIAAYCLYIDAKGQVSWTNDEDGSVMLHCPSVTGFAGELSTYGRIWIGGRNAPVYRSARYSQKDW